MHRKVHNPGVGSGFADRPAEHEVVGNHAPAPRLRHVLTLTGADPAARPVVHSGVRGRVVLRPGGSVLAGAPVRSAPARRLPPPRRCWRARAPPAVAAQCPGPRQQGLHFPAHILM